MRATDPNTYAERLAHALMLAAQHRHIVTAGPWQEEEGTYAFTVEICDQLDLKSGHHARVVVSVGDGWR